MARPEAHPLAFQTAPPENDDINTLAHEHTGRHGG
jgi:hypothetical protein